MSTTTLTINTDTSALAVHMSLFPEMVRGAIAADEREAFERAMQDVTRTVLATAIALETLFRAFGYETPEHSAMHTAYRAKTRRRNRR